MKVPIEARGLSRERMEEGVGLRSSSELVGSMEFQAPQECPMNYQQVAV